MQCAGQWEALCMRIDDIAKDRLLQARPNGSMEFSRANFVYNPRTFKLELVVLHIRSRISAPVPKEGKG